MLAMYLQAVEQSRVQQSGFPQSSLSTPFSQAQHHSTQANYGGRASLGYNTTNHYVPSSSTQYLIPKPYWKY